MAALSTLTDDFDDNSRDSAKWNIAEAETGTVQAGVVVSETNQRLEIALATNPTTGYSGYGSVNTYDFTGDSCFVRFVQAQSNLNTAAEAFFKLTGDRTQGSIALWVGGDGWIKFSTWTAGARTEQAETAYVPATHAWFRLKELAGTIYAYTAPSSASNPPVSGDWVLFGSVAKPTDFALTATKAYLFGGTWNGQVAAPGTVMFDGFNTGTVAPSAPSNRGGLASLMM
jgi:hypothetical protein